MFELSAGVTLKDNDSFEMCSMFCVLGSVDSTSYLSQPDFSSEPGLCSLGADELWYQCSHREPKLRIHIRVTLALT